MQLLTLTAEEFERMARLVYEKTGIHLPPEKRTLLSNRLRKRLKQQGLESYDDYYKLLCDDSACQEELPHFLSAVTTNETYFFRNERLWKTLGTDLIKHFVEAKRAPGSKKTLRIWSAACSTGAEAYTTAIVLSEKLPNPSSWQITIVASDISQRVLDKAREAVYDDYAVSKTDPAILEKYFVKKEDQYHLKPKIRDRVKFQMHNLRDDFPNGRFDLVFLRNVLMYFDTPMKKRVLDVVTNALAPNGYLIVGDVDPIRTTSELNGHMKLQPQRPGMYYKPIGFKAGTENKATVSS